MAENKGLTIAKSLADFRRAYKAKRSLIARELDDFRFALGDQWSPEDKAALREAGIKNPVVDNRIQPNIFLLTGLERQNRTDFKAFPIGQEDGIKAEIATALFKDSIKVSDFAFKSSDQFKDGVTCGESHIELYLDNTESLINSKPCWRKYDGGVVIADPNSKEYDYSDARFVYKLTLGLTRDELISLYPEKRALIEDAKTGGKIDFDKVENLGDFHIQGRDYPKENRGGSGYDDYDDSDCFDLIERYYKKWVEKIYVGDFETGEIQEAESLEKAKTFVNGYKQVIEDERVRFNNDTQAFQVALLQSQQPMIDLETGEVSQPEMPLPPEEPIQKNPERYKVIKKTVSEIWIFAHVLGIDKPLADERAWFYPKWKSYPIIPFYARFSTAPLKGDERQLLVQGITAPVKGVQDKHNKAEMLMLRHLNSSTNGGWISEEGAWVNPDEVKRFGTSAGVNLQYKKGYQKPERIFPMPLSQGHMQIAQESAEAIKSQLGMNSDLIAAQQGGGDSGRAIALRQRQGLLMVQEFFDNLSRTRKIAGLFLLSQLGEIYDTETAKKVLGEDFLKKNFPPPMIRNPVMGEDGLEIPGQFTESPMVDKFGNPMQYDSEMAEVVISEVLSGKLGEYDVSVGESVASETVQMAQSAEIKDIAASMPGVIPPDILIETSQLPKSIKDRVSMAVKNAQNQQAMALRAAAPTATAMGGIENA